MLLWLRWGCRSTLGPRVSILDSYIVLFFLLVAYLGRGRWFVVCDPDQGEIPGGVGVVGPGVWKPAESICLHVVLPALPLFSLSWEESYLYHYGTTAISSKGEELASKCYSILRPPLSTSLSLCLCAVHAASKGLGGL